MDTEVWSVSQYAAYLARTGQAPPAAPVPRETVPSADVVRPRYRSQLEAHYAQYLTWREQAGEVTRWYYEPFSLNIAEGCRFTPDFLVILPDGTQRIDETKGYMREAARVRLRVAARLYPHWNFYLVTRTKEGLWQMTLIPQ